MITVIEKVQRHCEGNSPKQSRKTNEYSGLLR